ncbi:hypothetical protein [Microbacterium arborescens]|uniref:hypothetical protein n=1 Tax=Microbacterium arborescens TaxID=33883 RepID=UPI002789151C|nr:hypothetical protein [Microbacterium arborescens]MDQ1218367.1 plasmid stabilization system protein ParE [Microbacterium arborescens]
MRQGPAEVEGADVSRGRTSRHRARVRPGVAIWWDAVSSGRFFTRWSALVAFPVSAVVLAPYATVDTPLEFLAAQLSGLVAAAVLAAGLLPVVLAERRIPSRAARGALVLAALAVAAVSRPFLNDVLAVGVFGLGSDPAWSERIVTNVVAWVSVLSLVAVTEQLHASSRTAQTRLADALRTVTDEQRRAGRYERETRDFLAAEISALRTALAALVASPLDFERVRDFSDTVRSVSHRARDRAGAELTGILPDPAAATGMDVARTLFERLRPPAPGLVGAIFAAGSAPFALRTEGPVVAAVLIAGVFALCLAVDRLTRRIAGRGSGRQRGIRLVAVWGVAGLVVAAAAAVIVGEPSFVPVIPALALPGVAVVAALCAEAIHRGRVETRRLGRALQAVVRSAADQTSSTRQDLAHASDVLHSRVQATCVILAARVDDEIATVADIRDFELAIAAGLSDALGADGALAARSANLAETVAIWGPVLTVSTDVDPVATVAMSDAIVTTRVVAIVAEGLVNAVKHAAARSADIEVRGTADGASLSVRVRTPGRLRTDAGTAPGLGVAGLGPSARVFQNGRHVVLEASVPVSAGVGVSGGQGRGALQDNDSM